MKKILIVTTCIICTFVFIGCTNLNRQPDLTSNKNVETGKLKKMTFSEIENFAKDKYGDFSRITENDKFKFFFWGINVEGDLVPENVIIKDKTENDLYYMLEYDGVWDMAYDENTNSLFVGVRYIPDIEDATSEAQQRAMQKLADQLDIAKDTFTPHYWERTDMCGGCPTFTLLERIKK